MMSEICCKIFQKETYTKKWLDRRNKIEKNLKVE